MSDIKELLASVARTAAILRMEPRISTEELRLALNEIERLERELAAEKDHVANLDGRIDGCMTYEAIIIAERDAARAEAEALRKDAERYRWLRSDPMRDGAAIVSVQLMDFNEDGPTDTYYAHALDSLDAAIDAMREGGT